MRNCLNCNQPILQNHSLKDIIFCTQPPDDNLCGFCRQQLSQLKNFPHCRYCYKTSTSDICSDCENWREKYKIFNQHFAIFGYNQFIHDYFKKYKRYGDVLLARLFISDLKKWARCHEFDVVTYIPSSDSHYIERGFDPVYELYKDVFPLTKVFQKVDADKPQAQKNKMERMLTPQTFRIVNDFPKKSLNLKILIVDDIYTTGRTVLHARQLLTDIGFQNICTFSLTR
ncbi:ComF family protein [Companilactobacillus ginsenosidimutans]|uniref:Competence protein ComF n=1 Tax=Companilactobacillus ginsenosidimutans TaxID=1007676 RepID=A0A0H4R356_9LACO|nr:ComF family protein [Companilactobacillus ginsenosidimutans]AKP68205.1 competence protein ComF [Companilactobacillus ginsenosidimutans]